MAIAPWVRCAATQLGFPFLPLPPLGRAPGTCWTNRSRPLRLGGETALGWDQPVSGALMRGAPSTARSMMVGQFSGADGRLPIRPRCGRVYE